MLDGVASGRGWDLEYREGISLRKEKGDVHCFSSRRGGNVGYRGRQVNMLGDGMVREFPFHMFSFLN